MVVWEIEAISAKVVGQVRSGLWRECKECAASPGASLRLPSTLDMAEDRTGPKQPPIILTADRAGRVSADEANGGGCWRRLYIDLSG